MKVVHSNSELENKPAGPEEVSGLYDVIKELPKPETKLKLTASQKYWWFWFAAEFIKTKQFTELDKIHLQNAAVMMDSRCKLLKVINEKNRNSANGVEGFVQKFTSGATNVTGYWTMYEKATKQLDDISAHFGLSIKDRKKLGEISKADETQLSLFEQMEKDLQQL